MIDIPRFIDHSKGCPHFGRVRNCQNNDGSPITEGRLPVADAIPSTCHQPVTSEFHSLSLSVVHRALALGFTRIKVLTGGVAAWKGKGYRVKPYRESLRLSIPTVAPPAR